MNSTNTNCYPGTTLSPLSGSEPTWEPSRWNDNKKYNNCYAYAMDDLEQKIEARNRKPIPGSHLSYYTCSKLIEGIKDEIPQMYFTTFDCQCEPGFKKIYAAVSDEDDQNDFHFWRQDHDGHWSHKPGSNNPSRMDGDNHPITNPERSNRNSDTHSYTHGCGFICIPTDSRDKS